MIYAPDNISFINDDILLFISIIILNPLYYIKTKINANIIGVNIKTKGTIHQYFTTD